MSLEILPKVGIGPIHLGMSRLQIDNAIRTIATGSMPTDSAAMRTDGDHYPELYMQIEYYDDLAINIMSYALADVTLFGNRIMRESQDVVEQILKKHGGVYKRDDSGTLCANLGIYLYVEINYSGVGMMVDAVHVFKDGYYG